MTPRKKNPKSENKGNQKDKFEDKDIEEKVRQETAEKINTEAEDQARSEADKRSKEITKKAEDKARLIVQQAEDKARLIVQQAEDKARSESVEKRMTNQEITKLVDYYPREEYVKLKENNDYDDGTRSSNPFMPGFSLWQDYAKIWMDLSKDIANKTTTKMIRYFESTNEKS